MVDWWLVITQSTETSVAMETTTVESSMKSSEVTMVTVTKSAVIIFDETSLLRGDLLDFEQFLEEFVTVGQCQECRSDHKSNQKDLDEQFVNHN